MKQLILISVILLHTLFLSFAQDDTLRKSKISKTWITLSGNREIKGLLYQTNDSSVQITNSFLKEDLLSGKYQITGISYNNISIIETWNINRLYKGVFLGAVGGTITGAVIGFSKGYSPGYSLSYSTAYSIMFGTLGLLGGTLIGAVVSSNSIKIPINGSIDNFNRHKRRLKKYSYIH